MTVTVELLRADPRLTKVLKDIEFLLKVRPLGFVDLLEPLFRQVRRRKHRDHGHVLQELNRLERTYGIPSECSDRWNGMKKVVQEGRIEPISS